MKSVVVVVVCYWSALLGTLMLVKRCRGICWCSVRSDAAVKSVVVVVCYWSALVRYTDVGQTQQRHLLVLGSGLMQQ